MIDGMLANSAIADQFSGQWSISLSSSQLWMPCWLGISPVRTEARQGEHMAFTQNAFVNRIPRSANRSICGVRTSSLPLQPSKSAG